MQDTLEPTKSDLEDRMMHQPPILKAELLRMSIYLTELIDDHAHCKPANRCDICEELLSDHNFFVDGRMANRTVWADMCWLCFKSLGAGIGTGYGQVYRTRKPFNKVILRPSDRSQSSVKTIATDRVESK